MNGGGGDRDLMDKREEEEAAMVMEGAMMEAEEGAREAIVGSREQEHWDDVHVMDDAIRIANPG